MHKQTILVTVAFFIVMLTQGEQAHSQGSSTAALPAKAGHTVYLMERRTMFTCFRTSAEMCSSMLS